MESNQEHLNQLAEIRSIMERSSIFLSLSGLAGIFAGVFALAGAYAAYWYFGYNYYTPMFYSHIFADDGGIKTEFLMFLFSNGTTILLLALSAAVYFSSIKASKNNLPIWDKTTERLLINLAIPLFTGGIFCLLLLYHLEVYLLAPATLIFYGLALVNAAKYTLNDIRYLGFSEIALGLLATYFIGYGLIFWALGFGVLHIIYGITMYYKYEAH